MSTRPLADADGVEAGFLARPPQATAPSNFSCASRGRPVAASGPFSSRLAARNFTGSPAGKREGTCGNSRREARWNRAGDSAGAGRGEPAWPVSEASATELAVGARQVDGDVLHARRAFRSTGDALLGRVLRFANASAPARSSPGAPRRSGRLP